MPPRRPRNPLAESLLRDAFLRRVDEEKRRHPEKSYAAIGRGLGIKQKDPARFIRKLRTGETSGVKSIPKAVGRPPTGGGIGGERLFIVAYRWWYTAHPDNSYWGRVHIRLHATDIDVYRLAHNPRVIAAVERDLKRKASMKLRERDGSVPNPDRGEYDFEIDGVYPDDAEKHRGAILEIEGRYAA